jgi:hypothetical protein
VENNEPEKMVSSKTIENWQAKHDPDNRINNTEDKGYVLGIPLTDGRFSPLQERRRKTEKKS